MSAIKTSINDLALLGGRRAFGEPLHVGRPIIAARARFNQLLTEVLDRHWLTNAGPVEVEFERKLAQKLGTKHVVAVCNATLGLLIAMRVLGLKGEVILPSFTFIATAHAVQWLGLTPVFCDVDPETHCIEISSVEKRITERTSGIIAVHTWGKIAPVEKLGQLAARRNLALVYDAAHAFGVGQRERPVGRFGDCEVFSFHATKALNSFEGGAISTNDDELAEKLRLARNFGFAGYDNVLSLGINAKMSEACAAMGMANLEQFDSIVRRGQENYVRYQENLRGITGIKILPHDKSDGPNYHYLVTEINASATGLTRDQVYLLLRAENALVRRYFFPGCHRMEPYRTMFPRAADNLTNTEAICDRVLVLPAGAATKPEDVDKVCDLYRFVLREAPRLSSRVPATAPLGS